MRTTSLKTTAHFAKMSRLSLACMAAGMSLAGCGGGGNTAGSTVTARDQISASYQLACVDKNHNFQCDDGDIRKNVSSSGDTQLSPAADEFVLIEGRDSNNKRTSLLLSEKGQAKVSGLSTLKTVLGDALLGDALSSDLEAQLAAQNTTLETRFAEAVQSQPLTLPALTSVSFPVLQQQTVAAAVTPPSLSIAAAENLVTWDASNANENRQLTAFGSKVLSNTESNRLYLFDASATAVSADEIDLIPAIDSIAEMTKEKMLQPILFALEKVLHVVVDAASAASAVVGQPSTEVPVTFEPGTGISAIQMVANGRDAYVLMNTVENNYTESVCLSSGSEGIYKITLDSDSSYRSLSQSPTCAHSGFSLIAADVSGANVVAWESTSQRLWLLDGNLKLQKTINTGVTNLQALAISPGGQFAALASYGQLAIIDLVQGRNIANLAGDWTNASQVSFSAGVHKVVVTSGKDIHTVALNDALQLVGSSSASISSDVLALSTAADGDSYVVTSRDKAYWFASQSNQQLAEQNLPTKLDVKRVVLADNQLLVLGQQLADDRYALFRLPLSLPAWPK